MITRKTVIAASITVERAVGGPYDGQKVLASSMPTRSSAELVLRVYDEDTDHVEVMRLRSARDWSGEIVVGVPTSADRAFVEALAGAPYVDTEGQDITVAMTSKTKVRS